MKQITTCTLTFLLFVVLLPLNAATFRLYVTHEVINGGNTLRVWINSDTVPGETAAAEIRSSDGMGGFNFSGLIDGTFDSGPVAGANWRVDITLPTGVNDADLQLANRNQSGTLYGFTDFIYSLSSLPVEFAGVQIKTQNEGISLAFSTHSESSNSHFEIQRSIDTRSWKKLGQLGGAGTTQQRQEYQFLDRRPAFGTNYYRIKQVDFDGTYSYSPIVSANWSDKPEITLYPNPTADQVQIRGLADTEENVLVELLDASGRPLLRQVWTQSPLDLEQVPPGLYWLRLSTPSEILVQERLIIQ